MDTEKKSEEKDGIRRGEALARRGEPVRPEKKGQNGKMELRPVGGGDRCRLLQAEVGAPPLGLRSGPTTAADLSAVTRSFPGSPPGRGRLGPSLLPPAGQGPQFHEC